MNKSELVLYFSEKLKFVKAYKIAKIRRNDLRTAFLQMEQQGIQINQIECLRELVEENETNKISLNHQKNHYKQLIIQAEANLNLRINRYCELEHLEQLVSQNEINNTDIIQQYQTETISSSMKNTPIKIKNIIISSNNSNQPSVK